ncbi:hypothetical protein BGW36DRAFT_400681 [Talaromyces proteolyticus]|uniref:MFS general substrate transporter n=1 Tax=Talaromyces proteolyticus TaxID=1131652 RepID=A0AAD4PVI4_9EURO|nr:uncharacterized protein BGW36DRAFT_400681 [Talaromyces proteolyticus]KAH8691388.1 hypothetical protein BGW36DRAFT_400681 [Talaromyces proteolyticus]
MAFRVSSFPPPCLRSPYWQNFIAGTIVGMTVGLYQALNLLGAGGGRPNSAQMVQVVNALLCGVFVVSSALGGSVLNTFGPTITSILGIIGYMLYVGGLWYFDRTDHEWFPIFGGVAIGISAGLIFVTMSSISISYSEEKERGSFIAMSVNLQATGAAVGGLVALIINRHSKEATGVPLAVYVFILAMMGLSCILALALRPASKVIREDGTQVTTIKSRGYLEELKANLNIFRDWKLLIMIPAFLPSECFLVYGGSVNAFHNNLRTRSLLSFCAVALQIPCGFVLQKILDYEKLSRRKRALISLATVSTPLMAAWIWEIIRVRDYDRHNPPSTPLDWTSDGFAPIFVLFMMNWVSSSLFQYIILYFLGCMTNSPQTSANYAGAYRSFLAIGETICFGVDSTDVPYIKEAGVIFAFYACGVLVFIFFVTTQVTQTQYLVGEEGVVLPQHVVENHDQPIRAAEGIDIKGEDPSD